MCHNERLSFLIFLTVKLGDLVSQQNQKQDSVSNCFTTIRGT